MKLKRLAGLVCAGVFSAALFSGCISKSVYYSPTERMVVISKHNNFLWLGPCGSPWNYDDQMNIVLKSESNYGEGPQIEAYQHGKLKVDAGFVLLNPTNKTVTVKLTFEGGDRTPVPFKYNGTHRYVEHGPDPSLATRSFLEHLYQTNGTPFYEP